MKYLMHSCLIATILILINYNSLGQETITEGEIGYRVADIENTTGEELTSVMEEGLNTGSLTYYFIADSSILVSTSYFGYQPITHMILNTGNDSIHIFVEGPGMKTQAVVHIDSFEAQDRVKGEYELTYYRDSTKIIQGLECFKAVNISKRKDGKQESMVFYLTDQIDSKNAFFGSMLGNHKLDYTPLEMTFDQGGIVLTFGATYFKRSLSGPLLTIDPGEFEQRSYDNLWDF